MMSAAQQRRCDSCRAELWFLAHFITGNYAPIDVAPASDGNVIVELEHGRYRIATEKDPPGERHKNHYATCPQSEAWRRRRGRRARR